MSKISDKKFTQAIHELNTALSSMVKIDKKPVAKANAQYVVDLLDNYETALAALNERDLTKKQKEELKKVETRDAQVMRESLRGQAEELVAEINAHKEKVAAEVEANEAVIAEAEEQIEELLETAKEAGQKFLKATLATMDDDVVEFKEARTALRNAIGKLPQAQRQEAFARFNAECQDALEHKHALEKKVVDAQKAINKAITNAAEKVSKLKVKDFLKELLTSLEQPAALEGPDAQLVNASNALVLADLPLEAQNALIKVVAREILKSAPESGNNVLVQVVEQVIRNLGDILTGKKPVLAVGYTVNGLLQVMLVNAATLAVNPRETLEAMFLAAYKQGADNQALYMGIVSVAEAGALLHAQGTDIRALPGVNSLSDAFGQVVLRASSADGVQLSPLDIITLGGEKPEPFTPSMLLDFLGALAVLAHAREELVVLMNGNSLEQAPADAANGIASTPRATLPGARVRFTLTDKKSDERRIEEVGITAADTNPTDSKHDELYKKLQDFCDLANEMENACIAAADTYPTEEKQAIVLASRRINDALHASARTFWHSKDDVESGFVQFVKDCNTVFNSDEVKTLKSHPDVWFHVNPILRGILGVLAAIFVIPALVVAAKSTHGYAGTFFSTPKSTVEVALEGMKFVLDEKVDEVKAIASPAA